MSTPSHLLTPQERALLATIAYTDQFSYPLTREELTERFLSAPSMKKKAISHLSLKMSLQRLLQGGDIESAQHNTVEYFFLPGQLQSVTARLYSAELAQTKLGEAKMVAALLARIPWVDAVYLTGSLAMGAAEVDSDIDFLVVTQPDRLWIVRFLTGLFAQLNGRRRSWNHEEPGSWCFNLWLDSSHLEVEQRSQDAYRAYEVLQAKILWTRSGEDVLKMHNSWIQDFFPLLKVNTSAKKFSRLRQKTGSLVFSLFLDKVEQGAWKIQTWYMRNHQTTERVGKGYAFFHPRDTAADIFQGWTSSLSRTLPKTVVMEILHPYVDTDALA